MNRWNLSILALPILFLILLTPIAEITFGQSKNCSDTAALLAVSIDAIPLVTPETVVGEWKLPLSPEMPSTLTEARTKLILRHDLEFDTWWAELEFTFPDPKPFGLPFSFQKVRLSWRKHDSKQKEYQEVDWANQCRGVGWSLFPGQKNIEKIPLFGLQKGDTLDFMSLQLWGSRN